MKWLGRRVGWDDSKQTLRFCKEPLALEEPGHDLMSFDGEWNILGSQTGLSTPVLLRASSLLWELRAMPMPPQHQVSPVCRILPAVLSGSHEDFSVVPPLSKLGGTYVCTPPLRTQKTCQDVLTPIQHISVLNKNLSSEERQPSANQQTTYLRQELRKLCSLSKSALDVGSLLSECWLFVKLCGLLHKAIIYSHSNPPA